MKIAPFMLAIIAGAAISSAGTPAVSAELTADVINRIRQLADRTDVVLRATVRIRKSATFSTEAVGHLVVARLDEVVSGPALYRAFVGRDITIQLRDPAAFPELSQHVFFATPWFFGETIGVVEEGSIPYRSEETPVADIAAEVTKGRALKADRELAAKIAKAQVVAAGKVVALRAGNLASLSEHDPVWSEADIEISETLKGTPGRKLTILFPASMDVMWHNVPKPALGQEAVWILNAGLRDVEKREQLGLAVPGSQLPGAELLRLRRLLPR